MPMLMPMPMPMLRCRCRDFQMADMCAFMGRSEDNCSNAVKQALKSSIEYKCGNYEQMRAIAHVYFSNRECSVQEAVSRCFYKNYGYLKFSLV